MTTTVKTPLALLLAALMLSSCGVVAGGVAGGVAGSEIEEGDGQFDPLENTDVGEEVYE
jgi:hypothetical protein